MSSSTKKSLRQLFGVSGTATPVTHVYSRPMDFDHPQVKAEAHVIFNEHTKEYAHVNTYDGGLGRNAEPKWYPFKEGFDLKNPTGDLKKKLKGTELTPKAGWPKCFSKALKGGKVETPEITEGEEDAAE